MKIIELHYNGKSRYFNINNISAFYEYNEDYAYVYAVGDGEPFYVDESPEEIRSKILGME